VLALQRLAGNAAVVGLLAKERSQARPLARDKNQGGGGAPAASEGGEGAPQGEAEIDDITLFERRSENKTWQAPMQSVTFFEKVVPILNVPIKITVGAQPSFETFFEAGVGPGALTNNRIGLKGDSASAAGTLHIPADSTVRVDATTALFVRAEPAVASDEWRIEAEGSGGLNLLAGAESRADVSVPVQFRLEGKSLSIDAEGRLRFEFKLDYSLGAVLAVTIIMEERKKGGANGEKAPGVPGPSGSVPPTRPPRPPDAPPIPLPDWLERGLPPKDMTPRGGRYPWRRRWDLKSEEREWILDAAVKISASGGPPAVSFEAGAGPPNPDIEALGEASKQTEDAGATADAAGAPSRVDVNAVKAAAREANAARLAIQQAIYDQEAGLEAETLPWSFWSPDPGPTVEPEGYQPPSPDEARATLEKLQPIETSAAALDDRYLSALELGAAEDPDLAGIAMAELLAIKDEAAILRNQVDEALSLTKKRDGDGEAPSDPRYTKYATPDGQLRPRYLGQELRKTFYGAFTGDSIKWMEDQVELMSEQQRDSGKPPYEPDETTGTWWYCEEVNMWFDRDVPNFVPTIDHMNPTVAEHWNDIGRKSEQPTRVRFYQGGGNRWESFRVIPKSYNSQLGGREKGTMNKTVEPTFRGP
jgi:hypothetical protein